jgi:hypothetical protein
MYMNECYGMNNRTGKAAFFAPFLPWLTRLLSFSNTSKQDDYLEGYDVIGTSISMSIIHGSVQTSSANIPITLCRRANNFVIRETTWRCSSIRSRCSHGLHVRKVIVRYKRRSIQNVSLSESQDSCWCGPKYGIFVDLHVRQSS